MKKITDIYTNLEENISLKQKEDFLGTKEKLKNNIDNIQKKKLKNLKFKKEKKLQVKEKLKINIEPFSKKLKKINIIKIIKKQNNFFYILESSFVDILKKFNLYKYIKRTNLKTKTLRIISILFLIFSFILIDKIAVENLVGSGIKNLYNIKYQRNIEDIETSLSKAKTKFNIANILFTPFKIIPEKNITNAKNVIYVLQDTSQIGLDSLDFYKANIKFLKNKKINEIYFANLLENSKDFFIEKENNLKEILNNLNKIKLTPKDPYYSKLQKLKKSLNSGLEIFALINSNYDTFLNILGKNKSKNYLIVFQNNDEIRPTGGFMGSAGIIKILAGKVLSFEKKDIYALEWDVKKNYSEKVKGPTGIDMLSERLGLRDSNAFINFESSAKSINYFMKKAGYNLDGIIFVNQKPILDLLAEIGEIDFSKYKSKITDKNFSEIISLLVEAKVSKKATLDTPKQVLFDFSNLLKEKIIKENNYSSLLKIFFNNMKSRDIAFVNFNKEENELLKKLGLTGDFDYDKQTDFDYPFFISVGGNKSDRYINRKYIKNLKIVKNNNGKCDLISHFEIILTNNFSKKDEERIKENMEKFRIKFNKDLLNIQGKGLNQNYTKVVIPENTILDYKNLEKYGYIVLDHKKYKTIEKLLKTKPQEKSYFNFDYKIPNINCESQKIAIYKQAGIYKYDLQFNYTNDFIQKTENLKIDGLERDFYYNIEK